MREELPHASSRLAAWLEARRRAGRMLVAFDFDGTLAPIAREPGAAAMTAEAAEALRRLAARADTFVAVISGRGLEDLRARVDLPGLYYAGNHGMEIHGPGVVREHEGAVAAKETMAACSAELKRRLSGVPGVILEDKTLTLSVHYRLVADAAAEAQVGAVVEETGRRPGVRITEGKKVLELRPDVDWHKGAALRYLVEALLGSWDAGAENGGKPAPPVIFIGDDVTDEDGFQELRGRGDGILVGPAPAGGTAASSRLASPDEVTELVRVLADGVARQVPQ